METREHLLDNGNTVYYKVKNDTCYQYAIKLKDGTYEERDANDMKQIIGTLETARGYRDRIRLWYGDINTGCSWDEEYNVTGYIGRSVGPYMIPILLPNRTSHWGIGILDMRIIRIDNTQTRQTLYKHPKFHIKPMEVRDEVNPELLEKGYVAFVYKESEGRMASFRSRKKAENYVKFLTGERYCK